jgi:hypothetical protein
MDKFNYVVIMFILPSTILLRPNRCMVLLLHNMCKQNKLWKLKFLVACILEESQNAASLSTKSSRFLARVHYLVYRALASCEHSPNKSTNTI